MQGVDISKHQSKNTVSQLAAKGHTDFVIVRGTIGTVREDEHLADFMADIEKYGYKNGFYVAAYSKNEEEARQEADYLISVVEKYGNPVEFPLFYDWEYFSADYIKKQFGITATKELVQRITVAFCERVKEKGYVAGVYSNLDFLNRFYTPDFWAAHPDYKLWYARPGLSAPDKECYLWQYASNNGLSDYGYNGNIDKNVLYGKFIGEIEPMKPLSEEPARLYIGFASEGDIKKLTVKINGLGISTEVADGYITTGLMSAGDQCSIMLDCNALGIECKLYTESLTLPTESPIDNKDTDSSSLSEDKPNIDDNSTAEDNTELAEEHPKDSLFMRILKRLLCIFLGGGQ